MKKELFGKTSKGDAYIYELTNANGMRVLATDYGATLVSIFVKDKDGNERDVILGYDSAEAYEKADCYFGATVGRYANRIANAKIVIDGVEYALEQNDNENSLHSGKNGMSEFVWDVKDYTDNSVTFTIVSPDLEQDFPGTATVDVTYVLSDDNALSIIYHGVSDKATTFNMTNHSYFNLDGCQAGNVYDHEMYINASGYTPVIDGKAIPTGEIAPVAGTPFDFTTAKKIGRDIEMDNDQLKYGTGYDHNFAIDKKTDGVELAAIAYSEASGIQMDVLTDLVGIQLYTANFIAGQVGKGGKVHKRREGFCLETQYFPNSINEPNFKRPIFAAGEAYDTTTIYKFSVR